MVFLSAHFKSFFLKSHLEFIRFQKSFRSLPFGSRFIFISLFLIFVAYPGQNHWQTLAINHHSPKVKSLQTTIPHYPIPISDDTPVPQFSAQAVFAFDLNSGTIIYSKNPDQKLFPASTTKIMTALVAMDNYSPNDIFTVRSGSQAIGNSVHLETNKKYSVSSLLYATLVSSGNDAALTLAENHPSGYQAFIELMNQKAVDLGLHNTHFSNVSGIESSDHYTTVHDLAILTRYALKNHLFAEIVSTSDIIITDIDETVSHHLYTTNQLLGQVEGLKGVKTGWTENAGECLVSFIDREHPVITIILNSSDRFGESQKLINWIYNHHNWENI